MTDVNSLSNVNSEDVYLTLKFYSRAVYIFAAGEQSKSLLMYFSTAYFQHVLFYLIPFFISIAPIDCAKFIASSKHCNITSHISHYTSE